MSLTGSLYLGSAAIQANQLALQVIGNNISNVSTPGYVREEALLTTLPATRSGNLSIGSGVSVRAIQQKIDRFLSERSRQATGEYQAADARATVLRRVEGIFNELTDADLSTEYSSFNDAILDVVNRPDDPSLRAIAVERGAALADAIRLIRSRIDDVRTDASKQVESSVNVINNGLERVRELNRQIVAAEAASEESTAGSLRTVREQEISKLSSLIDLKVIEQPSGAVNIYAGNDFLLFGTVVQQVDVKTTLDRGLQVQTLVFADSKAPVPTSGGRLGGLQQARDGDVGEILDRLDRFTASLIFEFNKIHASGQGLANLTAAQGTYAVFVPSGPTQTLGDPTNGLAFRPRNGSFEVVVGAKNSGQTRTAVIDVDPAVDTLTTIAAKLNAPTALGAGSATITPQGFLRIQAPTGVEFSFAKDTSGFLAAVGVNTFFTGSSSRDIGVPQALRGSPALFAAAANGEAGDATNARALVALRDRPLEDFGGQTLGAFGGGLVQEIGAISQNAKVRSDTLRTTKQSLEAENLSITGVSLDEEAVKLIAFQRSFQASARFISTVNQLLDEVINLGR